MWKVFLAEDESVVREGLRDNVPWDRCGFEFVGEAGDGELALAGIRKTKPDLLITDIRMPFMDGLTLCHMAKQENPGLKIIIISGYDDFEYARRAISEGVDKYLSKPVTRKVMEAALEEERQKLDAEQQQESYLQQYRSERQEYEQFYRRAFFEQVFKGRLSLEEMYAQADKIGLEITSPCFNLLFFSLDERMQRSLEKLSSYFLRYPQFIFFHWTIDSYGVLVRGEQTNVDAITKAGLDEIVRECAYEDPDGNWYVCAGQSVERFSRMKECYEKVSKVFSMRFLGIREHVLTEKLAETMLDGKDQEKLGSIDAEKADPAIIRGFLEKGSEDEAEEFASAYIASMSDALSSRMFRDYLLLSVRFTASAFVQELGKNAEELTDDMPENLQVLTRQDQIVSYTANLLQKAVRIREEKEDAQSGGLVERAKEYVEQHYQEEQLTLNAAAKECGVSPNYFSSTFSQQMHQTFIEYVTARRMEKARQLLKTTKLRSAQIAPQVGYKDPHYFSFVFRKTQGCTPREYRSGQSG